MVVEGSEISAPIKALLRQGYAFPCSYCKRMWAAKERGLDSCGQVLPRDMVCAGPIGGYSFPLYQGPLTRSAIALHCFRCGKKATEAVSSVNNPETLVGVCADHVMMLERLVPEVA
jgi:hypothetical protein